MTELLKQQQLFNLLKSDNILFQEFLDNSKESIILIDNDLIITEWNNATETICGISKEQALNKDFFSVINQLLPRLSQSPELNKKVSQIIQNHLIGSGKLFNKIINLRINVKNRSCKHLHIVLTSYKSHNSIKLGIISRDISKEVEFERKAKQNEKNLNIIFNNDAIGIVFTTLNGNLLKVNKKFCEITGYSLEELIELKVSDITNPDDLKKEREIIAEILNTKKNKYSIEKRYIKKDGSVVWVKLNTTLQWNTDGQVDSVIGFIEDITPRKKAEEALIESEKKYRFVAEKASDIIYSISLDSKITFYNKTVERIFDATTEEISKFNYTHLMLPKDKSIAKDLHKARLEGKKSPIFKHGFKTPKGKLVYLEFSVNPLFDDNKNVIGSLGIARDITDREIAEQKLTEKNIELENMVKTKDKFLSVIAHDLRDPFNILIGYSDLILDQYENLSNEELKKYVLAINNSSNNGFNLLKNLLDWSRAESGRIIYTPENVNLSKTIDFTIQSLKYAASSKNIFVRSNYSKDLTVSIDENMLKTVLRNLITNAIKFSYKNSEIHVEIHEEKLQFIISISDSGVGISDENKLKLFSPNSNFSQKGTTNERGTGLGLLICKDFVNKWNGRIWLESIIGEGSTFSFSIPK